MRHLIILLALTATACAKEEQTGPALATGVLAGMGRNALCIAGTAGQQRAGFIVFGQGDQNCSARGRLEANGAKWALVPDGEGECRIPLEVTGDQVELGAANPSCGYYCGDGVSFSGASFTRSGDAKAATDLAGDPLC